MDSAYLEKLIQETRYEEIAPWLDRAELEVDSIYRPMNGFETERRSGTVKRMAIGFASSWTRSELGSVNPMRPHSPLKNRF